MQPQNIVFIGTSLDGYIADRNGGLAWLDMVPNLDGDDCGYNDLSSRIDAIVMGRASFETVMGFNIPWPYKKPVFVLSNTMTNLPQGYDDKAELVSGELKNILGNLHSRGLNVLYIDGGKTIQGFLKEDLIDEMIITRLPVLLGDGSPLFGWLPAQLEWEHTDTKVYLGQLVQSRYVRKRQ